MMGDLISRNAIIQKLNTMDRYVSEELILCDTDKKFPKNEVFIVDDVYEEIVENLPPNEITQEDVEAYCRSRCLVVITTELFECLKRGLPSANQWIRCSDRLPSKNDFYLVSVGQPWLIPRFRWVDKAYYCDGKWLGIQEDVRVYAWMPLPQYESEEE